MEMFPIGIRVRRSVCGECLNMLVTLLGMFLLGILLRFIIPDCQLRLVSLLGLLVRIDIGIRVKIIRRFCRLLKLLILRGHLISLSLEYCELNLPIVISMGLEMNFPLHDFK